MRSALRKRRIVESVDVGDDPARCGKGLGLVGKRGGDCGGVNAGCEVLSLECCG